jgi:glycerol-3-phosphate dehydrogenase subunit C
LKSGLETGRNKKRAVESMAEKNSIVYFAGCMANYSQPDIGKHTIEVLEANGFKPVFPKQKCCGTPQLSSGNRKRFIENAIFNINSLERNRGDIVTACTSCALTLKHDYPKIIKSAKSESVASRTYDVIEYLALLKKQGRLNLNFLSTDLLIDYHTPCHLKILGENLVNSRLEMLTSIPGISLTLLNNGCCGMGGTFGVKKNTFQISIEIGKPLFESILTSHADITATDCPTCKIQIQQCTNKIPVHPISIVQQAYQNFDDDFRRKHLSYKVSSSYI